MKTFRAVCAKNNQKVELIVKYPSLDEARTDLHRQGYSIMDILEIEQKAEVTEKVFYFEIRSNGQKKLWQIQSNDIFKAYVKLVEDLRYDVVYIYDSKDASEEDKILTTSKVQSGYLLYRGNKNVEEKEEKKVDVASENNATNGESIYMKKELDRCYKLIDGVMGKIETLLSVHTNFLSPERKSKLSELYASLRQVKNITNIDKLKLIGESSLLKIGELELEILSKNTDIKKQEFLKETNSLLKQFWSSHKVRSEEDDVVLKIKTIVFPFIKALFAPAPQEKTVRESIDKNSFVYYKNLRELHTYQKKLKETHMELIKATIFFKKDRLLRLKLKQKLILQNIQLIKNRLQNKQFSYSKIVKWFGYYADIVFYSLRSFWDILLYAIFLYSFLFISFQVFSGLTGEAFFNFQSIYYLVLFSLLALLMKCVKTLPLFMGSIFTFLLFLLYLQINF